MDFNTCLLPQITRESIQWLELHEHYRRGVLPFAGGLMDQPNQYFEAMSFLNRLEPNNGKSCA